MTRLLEAFDVDVRQWRALTRTLTRIDFAPLLRVLRGDDGLGAAAKGIIGTLLVALTMVGFGAASAYVLWVNGDLWLGGTALSTQVACFTAVLLLMNHTGTLVTPQDHHILGFRPVSSRTYLAVRVTTLFMHTAPYIALLSSLPLLAIAARPDATLLAVAGGMGVVLLTMIASTLGLVSGYGWLLAFAGPRRFANLLNLVQVGTSLVSFAGLFVFMDDEARAFLHGGALPRVWGALLYPGTWFGSLLELAGGRASMLAMTATGLAMAGAIAIGVSISGKLSLEYAGRLARLLETAVPASTRSVWVPRGFRDETRAVAILVRSQFRNDVRFRMGVLAILPVTAIYFVLGWRLGDLPRDPFVHSGAGGSMMIQMAVFFLPDMLRMSLVQSDGWRASWIFHSTAADLTRLVMASQIVIAALFIVPYVTLLAVLFTFLFGHAGHAIVHAAFLGWLSYVVLQLNVLFDPRLPFSRPHLQDAGFAGAFGIRFVAMIGGTLLYAIVTLVIYRVPLLVAGMFAVMLLTTIGLNALTRERVEAKAAGLRYDG